MSNEMSRFRAMSEETRFAGRPRIAAAVMSRSVFAAIWSDFLPVSIVGNNLAAANAAKLSGARGLVVEMGALEPCVTESLLAAASVLAIPVLIAGRGRMITAGTSLACRCEFGEVAFAVIGYHDLAAELHDLLDPSASEASRLPVLRTLPIVSDSKAADVLASSALVAEVSMSVSALAAFRGVMPRTLEMQCERRCLPPPKTLLSWCAALHVAWRLGAQSWTATRAANEGGYSSVQCMARAVQRTTGLSLRDARDPEAFAAIATHFASTLHPDRGAQNDLFLR